MRGNLEFVRRLKGTDQSAHHMVTMSGVLIRRSWALIFRRANGAYIGLGEGLDGGSAALLVVTSTAVEDR